MLSEICRVHLSCQHTHQKGHHLMFCTQEKAGLGKQSILCSSSFLLCKHSGTQESDTNPAPPHQQVFELEIQPEQRPRQPHVMQNRGKVQPKQCLLRGCKGMVNPDKQVEAPLVQVHTQLLAVHDEVGDRWLKIARKLESQAGTKLALTL